ncbi:restriction endonuclease subunit S [Candidatus Kuenenia sp.]|uniref:restriction endonuclease subunit S n=1 Tax=Candidatus Kuenenia sp. TaxID=2499824 RepID=UPI00321FCDAF
MRNNNWKLVSLGEVVNELKITTQNPHEKGLENYIGFEHIESENLKVNNYGNIDDGVTFNKIFRKGDVLFGKIRAYLKKVSIAPFDGLCSGDILVLRTKDEEKLRQELLPFVLSTSSFFQNAIDTSIGTTMPRTKWQYVSAYKFPLPPLSEQAQIAELFRSIETAIEQAEQQEKNLKALQKTLSNGLASNQPSFGNLLNNKNCNATTFGQIADCIEQHDKHKNYVSRFVGLENIGQENLKISTWGNIADGTTFTKRFTKGDVLFGKRRAYLKKVAIADFDGICSGDILVLRAKEKVMLSELLPFYASAEAFIQHAVSTSAGSLSPRTKWKDVSTFEVAIPNLKTQEKIVEVFQQLQITLDQIKAQKLTLKNLKKKLLNEILVG